jgi:hypothetical protein
MMMAAEPIMARASLKRTSKQLAKQSARIIQKGDQLVLYDGYLSSLPFYLNIQRPIWVVWSGNNKQVLGSDYVAKARPEPAFGYGKILYTYEDFSEMWIESKQRLVVFINVKAVARLEGITRTAPKTLLQIGETAVVTNW